MCHVTQRAKFWADLPGGHTPGRALRPLWGDRGAVLAIPPVRHRPPRKDGCGGEDRLSRTQHPL
eukprot:5112337-Lingulodinium_polyedra.AAC.1